MDNKYQLDSIDEAQRLGDQSSQDNYSIKDELHIAGVKIQPNDFILDAGCGTGLLSRALVDLYPEAPFKIDAIDITDRLLEYANEETRKYPHYQNRIHFHKKDICELSRKNVYQKIFSRFVFQHIPDRETQLKAAKSLFHSLAPGGSLYVIDCYGFLSHLDTNNDWLKDQIKKVEECIPIDMNIGIKIRGLFLDAGVPEDQVKTQVENFRFETKEQRQIEAKLWKQRFSNVQPLLNSLLGEDSSIRLGEEYVSEILNPRTYIHAQKFIVQVNK
jgi:SAM-dependent methyltransferase